MSQPQWTGAQQQWRASPQWQQPQAPWNPHAQWNPQAQWAPQAPWNAPPRAAAPRLAPFPAPARQKSPLRWLLLAAMALGLLALAGLVLVNLTAKPAEVAYATDVELKTHFENLMECLVRVWQPPLTQAGFQIYRPTVTIYVEEITTKCGSGKLPRNAFYCGADQQIYWSSTLGPVLTPFQDSKYTGDYVMAHEFGHAIQGRTGILTSRNWLVSETPEKDVQLQLRRRTEVQADCFAGMYLRAVSVSRGLTEADVEALQRDFYSGGDDVLSGDPKYVGDHGRGASRRYWGLTGLSNSDVAKCNTFVAPANQFR
jgi:uncharacterized protein